MINILKSKWDRRNSNLRWLGGLALAAMITYGGIWLAQAADKEVDVSKLPPPADKKVDFAKDIHPFLKKACIDCHDASGGSGNFKVDTSENIIKGGEHGPAVIAGKSAKSPLIHYVARLVKDMEMPPKDAGDPLTKEQISLLRAWIDQLPKPDKEAPAEKTTPEKPVVDKAPSDK